MSRRCRFDGTGREGVELKKPARQAIFIVMKKTLFALGLLALVSATAFCQEIVVDYLEGVAERAVGSSWREISIGDRLPADATIRLSDRGYLELVQGKLRVSISQDGVYKLSDVIGKSRQVAGWDLKKVVSGKIKTALAGSGTTGEAVMGVRGDKKSAPADIQWVEAGESDETLAQGRALLEGGQYAEALKVFEEGRRNAPADEEQVFLYYIALSYAQSGKAGPALGTLRGVDPDPRTDVFTDLVLLEGRLLVESLAFQDALRLFNKQLVQYPSGNFAQAMLIMSAYCYRGLGDPPKAKETLTRARDLDPESELGKEAGTLMQEL
jgi:hypothetical protein